MRSYETARSLFSFLAFCAWSMVVIGVIAAFVGMGSVVTKDVAPNSFGYGNPYEVVKE